MIRTIVARLEAILTELDALSGASGSPEALEDLRALAGDYRRTGIAGVEALASKLEQAARV